MPQHSTNGGFYKGMETERRAFAAGLHGLPDEEMRRRYVAVLLGRLMFLRFLQEGRLLANGDPRCPENHAEFARRGLFSSHPAPARGGDAVEIEDRAFDRLFAFFDRWQWRLEERPSGDGRAIGPDVLGGVFEKQTRQKQTGAYYTGEDVTGYIARSAILPFLLDRAGVDLRPHSPAGKRLRENPDAYLFAAAKRGMDLPLPPDIAAARDRPAPAAYALPTETWREVIARRARCAAARAKLANGEVTEPGDFLTLNLDLCRLAADTLAAAEGPERVRAFWSALMGISILDPTCGSGAFLVAALDVLEPLYAACLDRMREFPDHGDLRAIVEEADDTTRHPHPRCFLRRHILERCLYGVDLLEEAAEICRLRLFLRLAAQAEPGRALPPLDLNIRTGNALVGFAAEPRAESPGHCPGHPPFHWFVEFPEILRRGGFDVIVGNPPYLEAGAVDYTPAPFLCQGSGAIHAMCLERSLHLLAPGGVLSLIVPMSLVSTRRMQIVRALLEQRRSVWYAHFSWRPARLFATVNRPLTLFVALPDRRGGCCLFSTRYQRWSAAGRDTLLSGIAFVEVPRERDAIWLPKLGDPQEREIWNKCLAAGATLRRFMARSENRVYYRTTGGLYWKVFTDFAPAFRVEGRAGHSSREAGFTLARAEHVHPAIALLSSSLFWWWYTIRSNGRDLNPSDIQSFPVPPAVLGDPDLARLGAAYLDDLKRNSAITVRHQKQTGRTETQSFKVRKSKPLLDEIDRVLARHYGFTDAELDFLIHYDIKYRMGREGDGENGE